MFKHQNASQVVCYNGKRCYLYFQGWRKTIGSIKINKDHIWIREASTWKARIQEGWEAERQQCRWWRNLTSPPAHTHTHFCYEESSHHFIRGNEATFTTKTLSTSQSQEVPMFYILHITCFQFTKPLIYLNFTQTIQPLPTYASIAGYISVMWTVPILAWLNHLQKN